MISTTEPLIPESSFTTFTWGWIGLGLLIFLVNLRIKAPYGRHTDTSFGKIMIDNRLGWIIMELPALLTCPIVFALGKEPKDIVSYTIVSLWVLHYINRTLIFPFRIRTKGKKMPLTIALSAIFFNGINGFLAGYYLGNYAHYSSSWLFSIPFVLGIGIFIIGFIINNHSDHILINLRKPGETGYKIPKGGMFKYVSCPNLMGEMMEWLGLAIASCALPMLSFFVWTCCNLIPRAFAHHKWYQQKFIDYPQKRKAFIPKIL